MHSAPKRQPVAVALLASSLGILAACSGEPSAPSRVVPPVDQMASLGTYIVDVNLKTGKVLEHAVASSPPTGGVDARLYGAVGSIRHHFTLRGGVPSAGNTYTLEDRIENQFAFPIGTNGPHTVGTSPPDTMGVYVWMALAPFQITGCTAGPTCLVRTDSGADGAYPFTSSTPQPYMYFKTVLEASDGVTGSGRDYTNQSPAAGGTGIDYSRAFSFRASTTVTGFTFGVSVSAALVRPTDLRWKVFYTGDSLPNRVGTSLADLRSDPDWRVRGSSAAVQDTSIVTTGCAAGTSPCFRIESSNPVLIFSPTDTILYFRSDSMGSSDNAYIAAVVAVANLQSGIPSVFLGMQDRNRLISFCLAADAVGFCDAAHAFVSGGSVALSPSVVHSWRIAKFAADSVVIFGDGARQMKFIYASLPAAPSASASNPVFWFGNKVFASLSSPTNVTSYWSSVVYEIGATSP